ncbi:hypothetical protein EVAR_36914_1 [Eumeta japonica]|uniref:Uncharacterized protein n=1 Tax=Eumeta variegata TaxID=151549 RepID=A0A4C1X6C2_EUMVA|nr:hypothetical protein EVAR_36914_1 [Eumeta japonica]
MWLWLCMSPHQRDVSSLRRYTVELQVGHCNPALLLVPLSDRRWPRARPATGPASTTCVMRHRVLHVTRLHLRQSNTSFSPVPNFAPVLYIEERSYLFRARPAEAAAAGARPARDTRSSAGEHLTKSHFKRMPL